MVTRRKLLLTLGASALAAPRWAWSQSAGRSSRLGWISVFNTFKEPYSLAFVNRLAELGFVEGRNLSIERRHGEGKLKRMPALSAELGKLKCDAYFGGGAEVNLITLTQASRETPIVFVAVDFDPVATGDVASLARPGAALRASLHSNRSCRPSGSNC